MATMGRQAADPGRECRSPGPAPFFYGYAIVAAGFMIQAVAWGSANSFGIYFDPLISGFGWSRAAISGAVSAGFLMHGATSILLGNLNDRFGPKKLMTLCGIFLGTGFLMMSRLSHLWQLYLFYGLIAGMGLGGMDVIPLSTASRWFSRKRGLMSGIIKVGTGLGMMVMPFVINWLIRAYGWQFSFKVLGSLILGAVILLAQVLVRDPAQKGQVTDNGRSSSGSRADADTGLTFREAVRTRQFWTVCLIYFIVLFVVYTIIMHIVQHAIDQGLPARAAGGVISILGGVSIAGRLAMGTTGDRIGEKKGLLICLACLISALAWLQAVTTLWMFYLFAVVYGFAHGGFFALVSPLVARLFGTRVHGLLFGIVIFSSTLGGAIGPLLAGVIFDRTGSYASVFLFLAVLSLGAMGLAFTLKPVASARGPEYPKEAASK